VKKDCGRYNKPSLIGNSYNKKLARTVTSGNRSEIHRHRKPIIIIIIIIIIITLLSQRMTVESWEHGNINRKCPDRRQLHYTKWGCSKRDTTSLNVNNSRPAHVFVTENMFPNICEFSSLVHVGLPVPKDSVALHIIKLLVCITIERSLAKR